MPKDGPGLLGFLGDLVKDTNKNLGEKLKRQADRFIRDDKGVVVGIREPKPGSQEEKDAFDNASGFLGTFAGVGAKTADLAKLKVARLMEKAGKDKEAIWDKTGWFRSPDGKWRFEITDDTSRASVDQLMAANRKKSANDLAALRDAEYVRGYMEDNKLSLSEAISKFEQDLGRSPRGGADLLADYHSVKEIAQMAKAIVSKDSKGSLKDVVKHEELFKAYPELKDIPAEIKDMPKNRLGEFDPSTQSIGISKALSNDPVMQRSVALHEIQHLIQNKEGFAAGGAPTKATLEKVRDLVSQIKTTQEALTEARRFKYPVKEINKLEQEVRDQTEQLAFLRASLKNGAEEAYLRLAGEAEARATQARATMNAEDRKLIPPWESYDREWADLIVRHNSRGK